MQLFSISALAVEVLLSENWWYDIYLGIRAIRVLINTKVFNYPKAQCSLWEIQNGLQLSNGKYEIPVEKRDSFKVFIDQSYIV